MCVRVYVRVCVLFVCCVCVCVLCVCPQLTQQPTDQSQSISRSPSPNKQIFPFSRTSWITHSERGPPLGLPLSSLFSFGRRSREGALFGSREVNRPGSERPLDSPTSASRPPTSLSDREFCFLFFFSSFSLFRFPFSRVRCCFLCYLRHGSFVLFIG